MAPSPGNRHDRGFPRPDLTLLYDGHAADHLAHAGNFPPQALRVTGSPALDALAAVRRAGDRRRPRARPRAARRGARRSPRAGRLEVHADRRRDSRARRRRRRICRACASSSSRTRRRRPSPTCRATASAPRVAIAPPALDLASLVASARLLVTVNSTVAIDAMTLGVPALVVRLPNNLTPFVEAGAMAGAGAADVAAALRRGWPRPWRP